MGRKCAISFCPSLEIMALNLHNEITYFGLPSKFEILKCTLKKSGINMVQVMRSISSYFRPQISMLCCFNSSKIIEIQKEPWLFLI